MELTIAYKIIAGVRRAVAAHHVGLSTIRAVVQEPDGTLGDEIEIPLDRLYSAKLLIKRCGRYQRVEASMADPQQRGAIPAIEVMPLPAFAVKYFVAVADVVLEE